MRARATGKVAVPERPRSQHGRRIDHQRVVETEAVLQARCISIKRVADDDPGFCTSQHHFERLFVEAARLIPLREVRGC